MKAQSGNDHDRPQGRKGQNEMTNAESYAEAIRMMIRLKGSEITNATNHLALERGEITLDMFCAGARVLAEEIINR